MHDKTEDTSWETEPKSPPRKSYSPDKNPHRSGSCQYCEVNLGSRKMHGPLTCSECRHLLAYDKQLEEENLRYQQQREERRPRQRTQESAVPTLGETTGQNPPVAKDDTDILAPRSAFSFPRQYAFDDVMMNPVIQPGRNNTCSRRTNTCHGRGEPTSLTPATTVTDSSPHERSLTSPLSILEAT
jgi:hypothetical protein